VFCGHSDSSVISKVPQYKPQHKEESHSVEIANSKSKELFEFPTPGLIYGWHKVLRHFAGLKTDSLDLNYDKRI
jgi:hypothetical protein